MKTYTTKQGDMWDAIAYRQCGSTNYTDRLMQLNMKYCGLFTFPAGIVLVLPEDEPTIDAALPPWKRVTL
jgi:phage tail protein X